MPKLESLRRIYTDHEELFKKKLADYGTADITEIGMDGVVSRLTDKFARLKNLLAKRKEGGEPHLESIKDTLDDIAGYSIIAILLEKGEWETSEESGRVLVGPKDVPIPSTAPKESQTSTLLIKRTEEAKKYDLPSPKKVGDVGYDLYCTKDTIIPAFNTAPINVESGISLKLPEGYWADIRSRSSAARLGIEVVTCTIDTGYTGPLFACCYNRTNEDITIKAGERVAQFIIHQANVIPVQEVEELPTTERGASGFGSTGV